MTELLESVLAEMRRRWGEGERPPAESFLDRFPALLADADAVISVVYAEMAARQECGDLVDVAEYAHRFPQYAPQLQRQWEVHEALRPGPAVSFWAETVSVPTPQEETPHGIGDDVGAPPSIPGFEVGALLGKGGMGMVYRARQLSLNREVALKRLRGDLCRGPEALARLRAEAEAAGRLQHPHIVQVHEFGVHAGAPYFSMELIEGESLHARLKRGPLPPRQAAEVVEALARAAQHAHEKGVIHRDLKPANVLIGADGTPKLTDFGLARRIDVEKSINAAGAVLGTPSYMAPEQARGEKAGPAADVYGLGAVLYHCLTGRPPFRGESMEAVLLRVLHNDPAPPRSLVRSVPRDLNTICLACLEKRAADRYGSAGELAEELRRFLSDEPIVRRPPGPLARLRRMVRRWPALTTAVALLVCFAGGLAFVLASQGQPPPSTQEEAAQAIRDEFARGQAVRLLQADGRPRYHREHLRTGHMKPLADNSGTLILEARSSTLLEIVPPDPRRTGYEFSANIQQIQNSQGEVGLALFFAEGDRGRERDACVIAFTEDGLSPNQQLPGGRHTLELFFLRDTGLGHIHATHSGLFARRHGFDPQPLKWRQLSARVTRDELQVAWEGRPVEVLRLAPLQKRIDRTFSMKVGLDEMGKVTFEDLAGGKPERPVRLSADQGLGLYVRSGAAALRDVILQPAP